MVSESVVGRVLRANKIRIVRLMVRKTHPTKTARESAEAKLGFAVAKLMRMPSRSLGGNAVPKPELGNESIK